MDIANVLAPLLALFEDFIGAGFLSLLTDLFGQVFSFA